MGLGMLPRAFLWGTAACALLGVLSPRSRWTATFAILAGAAFLAALAVDGTELLMGTWAREDPDSLLWARATASPRGASVARLGTALGMAAVAAGAHVAQRSPRAPGVRAALLGGGFLVLGSLAALVEAFGMQTILLGVAPGAVGGVAASLVTRREVAARLLGFVLKLQLGLAFLQVVLEARRNSAPYLLVVAEGIVLSLAIAVPWDASVSRRRGGLDGRRVGKVFE
jgi:hypothetical protein